MEGDTRISGEVIRAALEVHRELGPGLLESAYRDALALQKQVVAALPNQPEFRLELAKSLYNLGNVLRDTGRPKDAEAARAEALVIFRQLVAEFPNRPDFRQELAEKQRARSATKARGPQEGGRGAGDDGKED